MVGAFDTTKKNTLLDAVSFRPVLGFAPLAILFYLADSRHTTLRQPLSLYIALHRSSPSLPSATLIKAVIRYNPNYQHTPKSRLPYSLPVFTDHLHPLGR